MKMKDRNAQLKKNLGKIPTKKVIKEVHNVPNPDAKNRQGHVAYALPEELRLLTMLNTLKLEPQFYRTEDETMVELRNLIEKLAIRNPYFVAQCIVWSRCCGEGMRSINHLAAALLAPFASGTNWGKRFYSVWNRKENRGGCIYRLDDMSEIKDVFSALNKVILTNAMKRGFRYVLEHADGYQLAKYKKTTIDISNLVHPTINNCEASIEISGKSYKVIDAILQGLKVSADTWEVANVTAGQVVAEAVKKGKLSESEAKEVLDKAKQENWRGLLDEGKLGILAAIRNIRNILNVADEDTINKLCNLISNKDMIIKGKIMPYQMDLAAEVVMTECYNRDVISALEKGLTYAVPNLKEALPGKNLVIVDCSGSMDMTIRQANSRSKYSSTCMQKAGLLAAIIAKATNADVVRFGNRAEYCNYNPSDSVFTIAKLIARSNMGGTSLASAFKLITESKKKYDRIFIFSDNECNDGYQHHAYMDYIRQVNSPYIYSVDLAGYGTAPLKSNKVNYYFGYGLSMFTDIASKEFNARIHIDKVRKIKI